MPAYTPDDRRWYPLAALAAVAVYLSAVGLTGPAGEFPLNDDWAYARSAFTLAEGKGVRIDEWVAPTLVGQTLMGGLVAYFAGPSHLSLRLLTVSLAAITIVLLMGFCRLRSVGVRLAIVAVLAWAFNPLQYSLSMTFMTEVPFLSLVALAFWLFALYLRQRTAGRLLAAGAALGCAFLVRQTAVLFAVPLILTLAVEDMGKRSLRERLRAAGLGALPVALSAGAYYFWLGQRGGATPATLRKFSLLEHLTVEQMVGNSLGIFFYVSFLLIPVWVLLLGRIACAARATALPVRSRVLIFIAFAGLAAFGVAWFRIRYGAGPYLPAAAYHAQMPFLLNILFDSGLGPVTLNPSYYMAPATPVYGGVWLAITLVTAAGSAVLGFFATLRLAEAGPAGLRQRPMLLFGLSSFLLVSAFEVVFSHLQEGGLFDRHILTALMPFLVVLLELAGPGDPWSTVGRRRGAALALALVSLCATGWFSVAATHDYLAWNRVRWELGTEVLAGGADPLSVAGGFEFNAVQNYDRFRARGNIGRVYHWWYDRQDYLISMHVPAGYDVLRSKEYRSWLHGRAFPLFALKRRI